MCEQRGARVGTGGALRAACAPPFTALPHARPAWLVAHAQAQLVGERLRRGRGGGAGGSSACGLPASSCSSRGLRSSCAPARVRVRRGSPATAAGMSPAHLGAAEPARGTAVPAVPCLVEKPAGSCPRVRLPQRVEAVGGLRWGGAERRERRAGCEAACGRQRGRGRGNAGQPLGQAAGACGQQSKRATGAPPTAAHRRVQANAEIVPEHAARLAGLQHSTAWHSTAGVVGSEQGANGDGRAGTCAWSWPAAQTGPHAQAGEPPNTHTHTRARCTLTLSGAGCRAYGSSGKREGSGTRTLTLQASRWRTLASLYRLRVEYSCTVQWRERWAQGAEGVRRALQAGVDAGATQHEERHACAAQSRRTAGPCAPRTEGAAIQRSRKALPQPKERARSLPVPSGMTATAGGGSSCGRARACGRVGG